MIELNEVCSDNLINVYIAIHQILKLSDVFSFLDPVVR